MKTGDDHSSANASNTSPTAPDYLSAMGAITVQMMNHLDLDDLFNEIVDQALALTAADSTYISSVHASGNYLEMIAAAGDLSSQPGLRHQPNEGLAGTAWTSKQLQFTSDYASYMGMMPSHSDICQACAVPLSIDGRIVGVLGIAYRNADADVVRQLNVVQQFAQLASIAIRHATLITTTRDELRRSEALTALGSTIYELSNLDDILSTACRTVIDVFDASKACVYTFKTDGVLAPSAGWRYFDNRLEKNCPEKLDSHEQQLLAQCVTKHEVGVAPLPADQSGEVLCIPLIHESKSWGVFFANRIDRQAFSQAEINLLKIMGTQLSLAIHRHRLIKQIRHQAFHDNLTGLLNRFRFEQVLQDTTEQATSIGRPFVLMFIDLDGFKAVNDSLGHAAGDQLLIEVAKRFKSQLNEGDILGRLGGDEFGLIHWGNNGSAHCAIQMGESLLAVLARSISVEGATARVNASIGYSLFPKHGSIGSDLLRNADIAMYQAKSDGKNRTLPFSQQLANKQRERIKTEADLQIAIASNELELFYQPQICSVSGLVEAVEALVRWRHPRRGLISPDIFIPIAEDSGLISQVGDWVLNEACRQLAAWRRTDLSSLRMAINISSYQFREPGFNSKVVASVQQHGLRPQDLELEVTESLVMTNIKQVIQQLADLRQAGFAIAVDDFGTGYSSLQYLQQLPLDTLKIDRAFVTRLHDPAGESLVRTIMYLARELKLQTVAEGVETTDQAARLIHLECNSLQGYLYAKPTKADELPATIKAIDNRAIMSLNQQQLA